MQKEEKELERLREQERIRSGKELLAAQKLEADLQLKRNLEARRLEKEEVARAKDKVRVRLGVIQGLKIFDGVNSTAINLLTDIILMRISS